MHFQRKSLKKRSAGTFLWVPNGFLNRAAQKKKKKALFMIGNLEALGERQSGREKERDPEENIKKGWRDSWNERGLV